VPRISAESAIWAAGTSGQAWLKLTAHLQRHRRRRYAMFLIE
jgi:hypothetical protein